MGRGNETNYKGKTLAKKEIRVTHHIGGSGVPVGLADNGRIKDEPDVDDIRTAHWTGKSSSFPLPSSSDNQPTTNHLIIMPSARRACGSSSRGSHGRHGGSYRRQTVDPYRAQFDSDLRAFR